MVGDNEHEDRGGSAKLPTLDELDHEILAILRADARLSKRAIARHTGFAPGTIADRIARLERLGVIRGYHAHIDPDALGMRLSVLIGLRLAQGRESPVGRSVDSLLAVPEVNAVHVVAGQWDLLVFASVRSSAHLREVLVDNIWAIPGFHHSETMLVMETREREGHMARSAEDALSAVDPVVSWPAARGTGGG